MARPADMNEGQLYDALLAVQTTLSTRPLSASAKDRLNRHYDTLTEQISLRLEDHADDAEQRRVDAYLDEVRHV